jgi:DNA modification methylase
MSETQTDTQRYQVMPDLDAEEYRALKEDIAENGVIVPITVDGDGRIIDGYHRMKACEELGIDPPTREKTGLSEDEKYSLAWRLNMQRRHLDRQEKKDLIRDRLNQLIRRGVDKTDEEIADELGCSQQWVNDVRRTVVNEKLNSGKNTTGGNFTTVTDYATDEQKGRFIKDLIVENPDKSDRQIAERAGVSHPTIGKHRDNLTKLHRPQLINDDVENILWQIDDGAVDLIITDPPYGIAFDGQRYRTNDRDELEGDDSPDLMASVAEELCRVLAEDSHLYIFCRWDTLPSVLDAYGDPFDVDTTIVWDKTEGGHGMGDLEDFAPRHELIVKCSKGRRPINGDRAANVIRQQDVRFTDDDNQHPTQKPTALLETLIEKSSNEGEIVFDPFGGVHSTAVAATMTDRRALSVELDTDYHSVGRDRVDELLDDRATDRTIVEETEVVSDGS